VTALLSQVVVVLSSLKLLIMRLLAVRELLQKLSDMAQLQMGRIWLHQAVKVQFDV
jgi:hypothetical protein